MGAPVFGSDARAPIGTTVSYALEKSKMERTLVSIYFKARTGLTVLSSIPFYTIIILLKFPRYKGSGCVYRSPRFRHFLYAEKDDVPRETGSKSKAKSLGMWRPFKGRRSESKVVV